MSHGLFGGFRLGLRGTLLLAFAQGVQQLGQSFFQCINLRLQSRILRIERLRLLVIRERGHLLLRGLGRAALGILLALLRQLVATFLQQLFQIALRLRLLLFRLRLVGFEIQRLVELIQRPLHFRNCLVGPALGFRVGFLVQLLALLREQLGQLLLHARLAFLRFLVLFIQRFGLGEIRERSVQVLLDLLLLPRILVRACCLFVGSLFLLHGLLGVTPGQHLLNLLLVLLNLLVLGRKALRRALMIQRSFELLDRLLVRAFLLRRLHQPLRQLRVQPRQLLLDHGQIVCHHLVLGLRDEGHAIGFAALLPLRQRLLRRGGLHRLPETIGNIPNLRPHLVAQLVRQRPRGQLLPDFVGLRIVLRRIRSHAQVVGEPRISRLLCLQLAQDLARLARLVLLHQFLRLAQVGEERDGAEQQQGNDSRLHEVVSLCRFFRSFTSISKSSRATHRPSGIWKNSRISLDWRISVPRASGARPRSLVVTKP